MDFISLFYSLTEFLDKGGTVLYVIYFLAFILWFLSLERWMYFSWGARKERNRLSKIWQQHITHKNANCIRESLEYEYKNKLIISIPLMQTLVKVTPLLGLFGTVYGMIEIFDVIAQQGTGDARALANGISMATLPTMTGMAVGIAGLFLTRHIEATADRKIHRFKESMT